MPPTTAVRQRGQRPHSRLLGLGDPHNYRSAEPTHLHVITVSHTKVIEKSFLGDEHGFPM